MRVQQPRSAARDLQCGFRLAAVGRGFQRFGCDRHRIILAYYFLLRMI
jgi:hypothetical protein